jgi:hypothetical protein
MRKLYSLLILGVLALLTCAASLLVFLPGALFCSDSALHHFALAGLSPPWERRKEMRLLKRFCVLVLGLATFLAMSSVVRADAVTDWNKIAIQTVVNAGASHGSAIGFLDSAVVQAAVYDAVVAYGGRFQPYHVQISGASGSPVAAIATAAYEVLVNRFPGQAPTLGPIYQSYLTSNGLTTNDPGVAVGHQAAAGIIALRANDGSFPLNPPPFTGSNQIGVWRPTPSYLPGPPPTLSPALAPWLANVTPFTLTSPSQYRPGPPPPLDSNRYATAFNEIKAFGARVNSSRSLDQTNLALFWNSNFLVLWNAALRDIIAARVPDIQDSARLLAIASLAMADAGITAWDTKFHYVFWRPVTAVQEADNDGNPDTVGDPNWQPFINTPNYPEYTSGANNVTGAVTRILALYFGTDEMMFSVTTTNAASPEQTRTYNRFSDAAADVVNVRVYQGIHFRFADVIARKQGRHVAQWAFAHFLRPLDDDDHDDGEDEE